MNERDHTNTNVGVVANSPTVTQEGDEGMCNFVRDIDLGEEKVNPYIQLRLWPSSTM